MQREPNFKNAATCRQATLTRGTGQSHLVPTGRGGTAGVSHVGGQHPRVMTEARLSAARAD